MIIKKWMIVVGIIVVLVISILSGFLISNAMKFSKKEEGNIAILAENDSVVKSITTDAETTTVSPNCELVKIRNFRKCGHTITQKEEVPREIVNLNEDKVKEFFEGWNIDKFTNNEIVISKEENGICGEHYILRESDGYISISTKNDIGEYIFKGLTNIPVQYLPEEDVSKLELGIEVVGRDNLNKFLEDFE